MKTEKSNMYAQAETWNPFKGCGFDCAYCIPSFQRQAKRLKHKCQNCYKYQPHQHPERLDKIPNSKIVFVCGNGDLCFCPPDYTRKILAAIATHSRPDQVFYLQSKRPAYFRQFLPLPSNIILVTTLETNRDDGYETVSKAPVPSVRFGQFMSLLHERKVVTIEPILQFDVPIFIQWIVEIKPEYIWIGWNSRPKSVQLTEPSREKFIEFIGELAKRGFKLLSKSLRGIELPAPICQSEVANDCRGGVVKGD